jgi:hypothetical protein
LSVTLLVPAGSRSLVQGSRIGLSEHCGRRFDCRALLVHSITMQDTLTIRIDAALKQEAEKKAAGRDETLSQVVRRALRNYISERELRVGRTPRKNSSRKRV